MTTQDLTVIDEAQRKRPLRYVVPPMNVLTRDGAWRLDLEVPGVRKEDLHLDVEGPHLTLHAPRRDRPSLGWKRQLRLPEGVDVHNIQARLRHGVLSVELPARAEQPSTRIPILADEA